MGEVQLVTGSWYGIICFPTDIRFCDFGMGDFYEFEIRLNGIYWQRDIGFIGGLHSLRHD
jgi:hypothetical protein